METAVAICSWAISATRNAALSFIQQGAILGAVLGLAGGLASADLLAG